MSQFEKLQKVLLKELKQQEKLLELLTRERAAIAKMNREDVEALTTEKGSILTAAHGLGKDRDVIVAGIGNDVGIENAATFKELIAHCNDSSLKKSLLSVAEELKRTATTVQELNDHNATLIKQTLGIVVSTISIFRSAAGSELPSYGRSGAVVEGNTTRPGHTRQA